MGKGEGNQEVGRLGDADRALSASPTEPVPVSSADAVTITDAAHTPLPWRPEPAEDGWRGWVLGADGTFAALGCAEEEEQRLVNAAFIVRACNSHYELISALRAVVYLNDLTSREDRQRAYATALAALTKATGAA